MSLRWAQNMNPAASLLGPLYNLYEGALGSTGGWLLGQLTLVGFLALFWWAVTNREEIISGLDIRPKTVSSLAILAFFTSLFFFFFNDTLGFPIVGSIVVAASSIGFLLWCYVTLEGEPV
jgi:hypothetical protein